MFRKCFTTCLVWLHAEALILMCKQTAAHVSMILDVASMSQLCMMDEPGACARFHCSWHMSVRVLSGVSSGVLASRQISRV